MTKTRYITALLIGVTAAVESNPPNWDPHSVKIIDPNVECQHLVDFIFTEMGGT